MALPALNWRMLPPVVINVATPSMANILDAIYTMGTSLTYSDGTTRTPGAGSAWTWGRDTTNTNNPGVTTACYGTPPLNPGLGQKVLFAGSANAAAPTMVTSPFADSYSVNTLLLGLAKNAGNYNNANPAVNLGWRDGSPFSAGQFTGFVRGSLIITTQYNLPVYIFMWESQEAVVVEVCGSNQAAVNLAGALIDPLSSSASNCETDGRLYSIMTSGGTSTMTSTLWDPSTATGTPFYNNSSNRQHCYTCSLGATAGVRGTYQPYVFNTAAATVYAGGERPLEPLSFLYSSPSTAYAGQGRQIYWSSSSICGQELRLGAVTQGYTVSSSVSATNEAFVLVP